MVNYNTSRNIMWNSTINCLVALLFLAGCGDSTGPGRTPPEIVWEQTNAWEQNAPNEAWVTAIAINSSGNIFAGTIIGVFRSTDNGDSWTEVNTGLTQLIIFSLAINPSGEVFAGTQLGGIFRSTDNGDNWTAVNKGLTNLLVYSLVINSSGDIFAGTQMGGVFRSTDNGDNWTAVNTGLSNTISTLAINSSDHIFAGISAPGVFRSTDNGGNWTDVSTGLTAGGVICFAFNPAGQIFAGTINGVFRSVEPTI